MEALHSMTQVTERPGETDQTNFLRHLFVPVYMPAILFATGEGALIPIVPLTAKALGADLATAGIISGLLMIGVVLGDIPSGFAVAKWGEATAMRAAAIIASISSIVCWKAPNLIVLAAGVLIIGIASATFNLARHAFLTTWTPTWYRARAMSLLGGTSRIGYFVGPFLASPVIAVFGTPYVYWIHVFMCVTVLVVLQVMPDPQQALARNRAAAESTGHDSTEQSASANTPGRPPLAADSSNGTPLHRMALIEYFPVLIRLGTAAGILQMLRASRQVILPLWGVQLAIPEARIALIMGIAGAVDLSLFYTSGQVMDRFGRRWAAIPVLTGLSLGHIIMPLASAEWGYVCIAILLSLANGLGSGIVMTLGSDLASRYAPNNMPGFLGSWRVFTDSGSALGPLGISAMTALAGLPFAAILIGCCGIVGTVMMERYIPRIVGK